MRQVAIISLQVVCCSASRRRKVRGDRSSSRASESIGAGELKTPASSSAASRRFRSLDGLGGDIAAPLTGPGPRYQPAWRASIVIYGQSSGQMIAVEPGRLAGPAFERTLEIGRIGITQPFGDFMYPQIFDREQVEAGLETPVVDQRGK